MLREAVAVSLRVVSSIGVGPRTATLAMANTSPAMLPLPLTVTVVVAPPGNGPRLHDNCVPLPDGVTEHAGVDGAPKVKGTSPVNEAVSEKLGTSICELLTTVSVHVAAVLIATGFGAAVTATSRSVRPARSTV